MGHYPGVGLMPRPRRSSSTAVATKVERLPWERQPGETTKAWQAFVLYRDSTETRTIQRVAEMIAEAENRNPVTVRNVMSTWVRDNHWRERAEAYDLHVDQRLREARETELEALNRRQMQEGATLQTIAMRRLVGAPAGPNNQPAVTPLNPETMDWDHAFRSMELGARLERVAAGLPTDITKSLSMWPQAKVIGMLQTAISVLLPFIPEDRHPAALLTVEAALRSGDDS